MEGGASPRVAPFGDVRDYGGLLQRAGFALPVADAEVLKVPYPSPRELMREIRVLGGGNVLSERSKAPLPRRTLDRAEAIYRERHATPDGGVSATFEIVYLSGWAPDASQQKPLKPGSAAARLADALHTDRALGRRQGRLPAVTCEAQRRLVGEGGGELLEDRGDVPPTAFTANTTRDRDQGQRAHIRWPRPPSGQPQSARPLINACPLGHGPPHHPRRSRRATLSGSSAGGMS